MSTLYSFGRTRNSSNNLTREVVHLIMRQARVNSRFDLILFSHTNHAYIAAGYVIHVQDCQQCIVRGWG